MATFYKFGKLWEIPPAAARLGTSLPVNTRAFETFLNNLEPMLSNFICAYPRCPANPDLPAVRYAITEFMETQAPSNFVKERWAASYDPARKVTYVSWFLGTISYFLDKLDFTTLVPPPVEPKPSVFIAGQPRASVDPLSTSMPPGARRISGKRGVSKSLPTRRPDQAHRQFFPPARLWKADGPAALAALEARYAGERQAQRRHAPREAAPERPAPAWTMRENVIHVRLEE